MIEGTQFVSASMAILFPWFGLVAEVSIEAAGGHREHAVPTLKQGVTIGSVFGLIFLAATAYAHFT